MADAIKKRVLSMVGDLSAPAYDKVAHWFKVAATHEYNCHDAILYKILKLESVTYEPSKEHPHNARTVFSFVVPQEMCNVLSNMHGGAVAMVFDRVTSLTVSPCMKEGFWDAGHVSRNLNCTYLRPAPLGSTVFVESWVVNLGKRMGLIMGTMRLGSMDGKICYTCEHGKVSLDRASL